jgi:hypothetical protein
MEINLFCNIAFNVTSWSIERERGRERERESAGEEKGEQSAKECVGLG